MLDIEQEPLLPREKFEKQLYFQFTDVQNIKSLLLCMQEKMPFRLIKKWKNL